MRYSPKCDIEALVNSMTLDQKIELEVTTTEVMSKAMPELGIPAMCIADGVTGISYLQLYLDHMHVLTKQAPKTSILNLEAKEEMDGNMENTILRYYNEIAEKGDDGSLRYKLAKYLVDKKPNGYDPTTFPSGNVLGSTWNPELVRQCGKKVGEEMAAFGVDVVLGPNVDIQRDPLGGRGYECYSEDPTLVGKIATAFVQGMQSEGVAACIKHFAVNNQETDRGRINAVVSQRALREIYLRGFEAAIKDGNAKSIMMAYNKVNGVRNAENSWLMKDILRSEWGFKGVVVSDWGAARDEPKSISAGLDLVLTQRRCDIKQAIADGEMTEADLDRCVTRILRMYETLNGMTGRPDPNTYSDKEARAIVYDCIVDGAILLKNEDALPLNIGTKTAYWGRRCKKMIDCGGGSTQIFTKKSSCVYDRAQCINGTENCSFEQLTEDTKALVYTVAYPGHEHSDNPHLLIEHEDRIRIREVLRNAKLRGIKTIVILNTAGPVDMREWIDEADAVLCVYLPGCEGGNAVADMIYGLASPAGRLAQTFPRRYEDTPSALTFPGDSREVIYGEDIFVGYRYYDKRGIEPAYPFGYGLGYTKFRIETEKTDFTIQAQEDARISIPIRIQNIGNYAGSEVIQVYAGQKNPHIKKPVRELVGFVKVYLKPGETKEAEILIRGDALRQYDPAHGGWCIDPGEYTLYIGCSSRDFFAQASLHVEGRSIYGIGTHTTINEIARLDFAVACLKEIIPDFEDRLPAFLRDFDGESLGEVYASVMDEYYINSIQGLRKIEEACRKMNEIYMNSL